MKRILLDNDALSQVARPARYTGGEWNSIVKDWDSTSIRVALSYPDLYDVGMSNMALPILYDILNRQPNVLAERVFAPWVDMEAAMRARGIPLFSLESRRPLRDFDVIGFSLGYELTYTNVLNMLDLAGVPLLASERGDPHPFIIAGGSCTVNPEPMADFIDFFVVGDGEEIVLELVDMLRGWKQNGRMSRRELLLQAASISGIYVPSLYQPEYRPDGLLESIRPSSAEARPVIERRRAERLAPPVTRPVVPYIETIHDRAAIEIQRGCSRGCRFCQAGMIYRPVRERPHQEVLQAAGELISNCGYEELSLVSLNTSDYAGIDELAASLLRQHPGLTISLPSLRIDSFSSKLMNALASSPKAGLTFAPEAGSERLRQVINKVISEDELMDTLDDVFDRGWNGIKLYFMLGLPTETDEDVQGIVRMVGRIRSLGSRGRQPQVRVSASTFVPKPHTPFQWAKQEDESRLNTRIELLRNGLRRKGVKVSWQDPKLSLLEAALSRGDRRVGQVILNAWRLGSSFDAWNERFDFARWAEAFRQAGLDPDFYARRERDPDEVLPWSHINTGVTAAFLKKERLRAIKAEATPDCRYEQCTGCGLQAGCDWFSQKRLRKEAVL